MVRLRKGRMIIGYGTFALADFLGTVIPVILFGTASFVERASKWKMSEAQINEALSYFKVSWAVGSFNMNDSPQYFLNQ